MMSMLMAVVRLNRQAILTLALCFAGCVSDDQSELTHRLAGQGAGPISELYAAPPGMSSEQIQMEREKIDHFWSVVQRRLGNVVRAVEVDEPLPANVGFGIGIGNDQNPSPDGEAPSSYRLELSGGSSSVAYLRVFEEEAEGGLISYTYLGLPEDEVAVMAEVFEEFVKRAAPSLFERIESLGGAEAFLGVQ